MSLEDKIDGYVTYAAGVIAMSTPVVLHWMSVATSVFQFLISLGGLVLVLLRVEYERKLHK